MGKTYYSVLEALSDLTKNIAIIQGLVPIWEKKLFLDYYNAIYNKVPIKTGLTRSFPVKHRPTNFSRNIMEWSPKKGKQYYVGYIYLRNKTGIPEWDMATAEKINNNMVDKLSTNLIKVFK